MRLSSRYLFPIAEGTDPRRNFPATVDGPRTEGIEAELGRIDDRLTDMRYTLIRQGNWSAGAISAPTTTTISFGTTFASPPYLMLSWFDGQYGVAASNNITTTGATLLAVPISGSTIVRVAWIAFGMKTSTNELDTIPDADSTRQERLDYLAAVGVHGVDALSTDELLDLIRDLADTP